MLRVVAALACAGPAWPAVHAVVTPAVWRGSRRLGAWLVGALALYGGAAAAAVVFVPQHVLAGIVALGVAFTLGLLWHGRAAAGQHRGLPRGSLALLQLGAWTDPSFYARNASRHGGLFKTRHIARPMACLVDLPRGRRLLRERDADLEAPPLPFNRFVPGGFLRWRDHAAHAHYKDIFRVAFSREAVVACEPDFREWIQKGLAAAAAEGAAPGVQPRALADGIVYPLWVRLFLGFAPDSAETARLRELDRVIDVRRPQRIRGPAIRKAVGEVIGIIESAPSGDRPCFLAELRRHRPDAIADPAVLGNLVYFLQFTWRDLSGLLAWIVRMLADHPEVAGRVRRDQAEDDGTAARVVLETLRLSQSEYIFRRAKRELRVDDVTIPPGWLVRLCVREAHRDPAVFERPEEFDPDRFAGRTYTRDEYSPFGAHRLACLGEHVAHAVGRIFATELCAYDLRVVHDGPVEFGSWNHWRPSARLRVGLSSTHNH